MCIKKSNKIGIITDNEEKARKFMEQISIKHKEKVIRFVKIGGIWELLLSDDKHYVWVSHCDGSKQYDFGKAHIDRDFAESGIVESIYQYFGKINIEMF